MQYFHFECNKTFLYVHGMLKTCPFLAFSIKKFTDME